MRLRNNLVVARPRLQPGRVFSNFWGDLSLESLPSGAGSAATVDDLAYHHLNHVWSELGDKPDHVIFAMPGSYTREQLSLLLGMGVTAVSIPCEPAVYSASVVRNTQQESALSGNTCFTGNQSRAPYGSERVHVTCLSQKLE